MKSILLLEDRTTFEGSSIGAEGTTIGEVVFATAMTGYQEMLTDPSFAGQLLTLTYPLIGNYGINPEDVESSKLQVEGFIVRELCEEPSNWRSTMSLREYLTKGGIVSMQGVDTRALTRHLRVRGVMMGIMSNQLSIAELKSELEKAPNYGDINFVERVSTDKTYTWDGDECSKLSDCPEPKCHVALIDMGVKRNIARCLVKRGCKVTILPFNASAEDVLALKPDGIVFSPGPGDPRRLSEGIQTMKDLIGKKPILGICLGHQMLGMALGAGVKKLKFGHRGANHPVKNLINGRVSITSQNHGYVVDAEGLSSDAEVSHINLNDNTVEGLRHKKYPIFSIQYHPEASAGPNDEEYLFQNFVDAIIGR